jgi:dTDP-4-amino-4,6-dideoxygalactose transaminase
MKNSRIWLSSPHMCGIEKQFVNEILDPNSITPLGSSINGFEQDLEKYMGQDSEIAVLTSGTAAIHLGLILLGVKSGDEVICQSMTFSASANPIIYLGAKPVFVDSELETWNICPITLEEAIIDRIAKGKKPKAIIAVHLFGMPYKVDEIKAISNKYEIPILEDSAEALGSTYKNQKCGTFGDIGVLSFNGNKIITASGGGALISKCKEIKEKTIFLATQARDQAPHYQHSSIGYNYSLSNVCAAVGRGQMTVLSKYVKLRREMHNFYIETFKNVEGVKVFSEPSSDFFSNHWLSAIIVDPDKTQGKTREDLRIALENQNIESRPLWKPMHMQPIFKQYPYYGGKISEELFSNGLCLPSGSNTTFDEKSRIINELQIFF